MTTNQPPVSAHDQKLEALGNALIDPKNPKFPLHPTFFRETMVFGDTTGMTNGEKCVEFRNRAYYSTLRASAYEKVLSACLARTSVARTAAFLFVLAWGGTVLAFNYSKVGELKASLASVASVIPGLGGLAGGAKQGGQMTPEETQMQEIRRQIGQ